MLLRTPQAQSDPLNLAAMEATFEQALSAMPFVSRFYVWSDVSAEHRGELLAYDRENEGFHTDLPEGDLVVQRFRELAPQKRAISVFEAMIDGRRTYFQAQLRFVFPARDKMTSFAAFRVDAERLRSEFLPALVTEKLKSVEGPTGFPPLSVTLVDDGGRVVFPPGGSIPTRVRGRTDVPAGLLRSGAGRRCRRRRTGNRALAGAHRVRQPDDPRDHRCAGAAAARVDGDAGRHRSALGVFFVARAAAREVRVAELKSNFVSSVSHDLKTPLALIQLFAETLELGRLKNTDRAQEYYRIINSEARKLTRLINNLLDFSKIEAGLRSYKRKPVNLTDLTRGVLESLDSQFRHNQFTVTSRLDSDVPVLIDPEAAVQALENLISNAMKYSPEHREIVVEVDRADGYGVVRVSDRGIGVSPRLQRKIFRKFYRIQTDAGSGPQGTGLGLAIVDHVMRGHDGFVRVESEPGRGSTFTLHFPLYAGETHGDETHSGDRGRAPDVARSA